MFRVRVRCSIRVRVRCLGLGREKIRLHFFVSEDVVVRPCRKK